MPRDWRLSRGQVLPPSVGAQRYILTVYSVYHTVGNVVPILIAASRTRKLDQKVAVWKTPEVVVERVGGVVFAIVVDDDVFGVRRALGLPVARADCLRGEAHLFFHTYVLVRLPHSLRSEQNERAFSRSSTPTFVVPDQICRQGVNTVATTCRTPPLNCIGSSAVLNQ